MARVIANWELEPRRVMRALGIRCQLGPFDFQPLREYRFGVLGYDQEEGLKFEAETDRLSDLVAWVRRFHSERNIPLIVDGEAVFSCMSDSPNPGRAHPEDPIFEAAGLVRCKDWDFVWELRE